MKPRERVYRALTFGRPDRIPIWHSPTRAAIQKYEEELLAIFREFPADLTPWFEFGMPEPTSPEGEEVHKIYTDQWGVTWEERRKGIRGLAIKHPLDDWKKLATYELPPVPPDHGLEFENEKREVNRFRNDYLVEGCAEEFFQVMTYLRGYENLMIDFIEKPPELYELADRMEKRRIAVIRRALKMGLELIVISDDWGTQTQLAANPSFWREFFRPRYQKFINAAHEGNALVFMHSDGYILDIIPDLIEMGLDGLNPQFSCHNLEKLASICRGKICIISDIDRQYTLPFGTPEEVRNYVKRVVNLFALPEGGLVGYSQIDADVPLKNVRALYEAWRDFEIVNNKVLLNERS